MLLAAGAARAGELIIVSGGPALRKWEKSKVRTHDVHWGNFVDSAMTRMGQIKPQIKPGDVLSWLVYRPGYVRRSQEQGTDLLAVIQSKADAIGVELFWFDTQAQFINYLNSGRNRSDQPILHMDFFGHSNKVNWMFDYSNEVDGCSTVFFHTRDFTKLARGIFHPKADLQSFGCHSGEYFTGKFANVTGTKMTGAVGKTDYSLGGMPVLSTSSGRWTE